MSQQTPIDSIGLNRDQTQTSNDADEKSIRAILHRMIEAWNAGDGTAFAAPFTDEVDFVVWDGTHLEGRQELAVFTQQAFDTVVKGSRLEGEVKFVRFLSPTLAVMHSVVRTTLAGQTKPLPSRHFMELIVVTKRDGQWRGQSLMNARKLTMERQLFLDDIDSLPADAQRQVSDLVASLKRRRH